MKKIFLIGAAIVVLLAVISFGGYAVGHFISNGIDETEYDSLVQEKSVLEGKVTELTTLSSDVSQQMVSLRSENNKLKNQLQQLQDDIDNSQDECNDLQNEKDDFETKIQQKKTSTGN